MSVTILKSDCREILRTLPSESVHCVVTSPPYWGLRDYGTAQWEGGDAGCDHVAGMARQDTERETPGGRGGSFRGGEIQFRDICGKCGARRIDSQLGLEPTYQEYVANMVEVFREVRRVLRKDGTLWLNLGDSYTTRMFSHDSLRTVPVTNGEWCKEGQRGVFNGIQPPSSFNGLKPKDLCGIPWRVAFALQADGWWLRQDIIWSKPNPMPESVTDRCTKAHEYLFLLSKSERYYWDAAAIAEEGSGRTPGNRSYKYDGIPGHETKQGILAQSDIPQLTRNKRSVWEIATAPFPEAHFATFPPALIEPCIKAGTSEKGCCAKCGAPWVRETSVSYTDAGNGNNNMARKGAGFEGTGAARPYEVRKLKNTETLGWSPCPCSASTIPCTILDPFGGAGTTGLVADRLGRNAIMIELNPEYAAMAERRIQDDAGMFAQVAAE